MNRSTRALSEDVRRAPGEIAEIAEIELPHHGNALAMETRNSRSWTDWKTVRPIAVSAGWWPVIVETEHVYQNIAHRNWDGVRWSVRRAYERAKVRRADAVELDMLRWAFSLDQPVELSWTDHARDIGVDASPVEGTGTENWGATLEATEGYDVERLVETGGVLSDLPVYELDSTIDAVHLCSSAARPPRRR